MPGWTNSEKRMTIQGADMVGGFLGRRFMTVVNALGYPLWAKSGHSRVRLSQNKKRWDLPEAMFDPLPINQATTFRFQHQ
jgi:hypothetical protein